MWINIPDQNMMYISPEQTGLLNQSLDYRSDIYSLGITFYETITGKSPFAEIEGIDLLHMHLVRNPPPADALDLSIPPVLVSIIMKCIAKQVEDRYQSATGLKRDLQVCLKQLMERNTIEAFAIGSGEVLDRFHIPHKLYGRDEEVKSLLAALDRCCLGGFEVIFIRGAAGSGKTHIAYDLQKQVVQKNGYFLYGKFDPLQKKRPYSGWIMLFQQLIKQILMGNQASIHSWRERLRKHLGQNVYVLMDMLPDLTLLVDMNPLKPAFNSLLSFNRLYVAFTCFINACLDRDHPLVIVLDDLHWADEASLKFFELLMSDITNQYLLCIAVYACEEKVAAQTFLQAQHSIQNSGGKASALELGAIAPSAFGELIADALRCTVADTKDVAAWLYQKTQGNLLFIFELLKLMHHQGVITLSDSQQYWVVDMQRCRQLENTDTLKEVFKCRLSVIPAESLTLMAVGAVIGYTFDLHTLAAVQGASPDAVHAALLPAICEDFIFAHPISLPAESSLGVQEIPNYSYTFNHDSILLMAYGTIALNERVGVHMRVAQGLLKCLSEDKLQNALIPIAYHLNYEVGLASSKDESESELPNVAVEDSEKFARINLEAGCKAFLCAAYQPALLFYTRGILLLKHAPWNTYKDLNFTLYLQRGICESLLGERAKSEATFAHLLKNVLVKEEKARIYFVKACLHGMAGKNEEAIQACIEALKALNIDFSCNPTPYAVYAEKLKFFKNRAFYGLKYWDRLPLNTAPHSQLLSNIYYTLLENAPLTMSRDKLPVYLIMHILNATYANGILEVSLIALMDHAKALASEFCQQYTRGCQEGKIVLRIAQKFPQLQTGAESAAAFYALLNRWEQPARANIEPLKKLAQQALDSSNITLMCRCLNFAGLYLLLTCEQLDSVREDLQRHVHIMIKYHAVQEVYRANLMLKVCLALQGLSTDPCDPNPKELFEIQSLPFCTPEKATYSNLSYETWRVFLLYTHEKFGEALIHCEKIRPNAFLFSCNPLCHVYYFYYAMTLAAVCGMRKSEKSQHLSHLKKLQARFKKWSNANPSNFQHKYLLLSAEIARLNGDVLKAENLYKKSIAAVEENGFLCDTALAYELMAIFFISQGKKKDAANAVLEACHAYARWGAITKLRMLKSKYRTLLNEHLGNKRILIELLLQDNSMDNLGPASIQNGDLFKSTEKTALVYGFDISALELALQKLSSETELDKLLSKFMHVLIVNSGSDKAFLLLKKGRRLFLKAEISLGQDKGAIIKNVPLEDWRDRMCLKTIYQVSQTLKELLINDTQQDPDYRANSYVQTQHVQSILCIPLIYNENLIGIIYLENKLSKGLFTPERLRLLHMLMSYFASFIEHALSRASSAQKLEEAYKELRTLQNQLIQQEKMASLGLLTAGIAHEIKNPLNFIINFSELSLSLLQEIEMYLEKYQTVATPEEFQEIKSSVDQLRGNTNTVTEQGRRADSIIKRMLAHSSSSTGDLILTDIRALLEESIALSYHGMRAQDPLFNVTFERDYDTTLKELEISPQEISRVILNLLNNAYYTVTLKKKELGDSFNPILHIATRNLPHSYEIRIRDNGKGIPENALQKIFTPFFTTKPQGLGTGLGLSLSYNIITQQHGGQLSFSSKEGEFTEFVITLPKKRPSKIGKEADKL